MNPWFRLRWAVILLASFCSLGCLWDRDTLGDELRGLPDTFHLCIGRWWKHDPAYYRQRVEVLTPQLAQAPDDLPAYDDLAVALEHLDQRDEALAVLALKEAALARQDDPDQRYRLLANRGTVYAHQGKFAEALVELDQALAINPQAHFGRERYQILAIRYVAAANQDPGLWERENFLSYARVVPDRGQVSRVGHFSFQRGKPGQDETNGNRYWSMVENQKDELTSVSKADLVTAIAGMVRYGGKEGAELYRTLGDVELARGDLHLAWLAYARAQERGHPAAGALSAAMVSIEKHWQSNTVSLESGPEMLRAWTSYRINGEAWLAAFQEGERLALGRGKDPGNDAVLTQLIADADRTVPAPVVPVRSAFGRWLKQNPGALFLCITVGAFLVVFAVWLVRRFPNRRKPRTTDGPAQAP